jgi:hypothetical protein
LKELGLKKLLTGGSLGMLRRRLWFWCNVVLDQNDDIWRRLKFYSLMRAFP